MRRTNSVKCDISVKWWFGQWIILCRGISWIFLLKRRGERLVHTMKFQSLYDETIRTFSLLIQNAVIVLHSKHISQKYLTWKDSLNFRRNGRSIGIIRRMREIPFIVLKGCLRSSKTLSNIRITKTMTIILIKIWTNSEKDNNN